MIGVLVVSVTLMTTGQQAAAPEPGIIQKNHGEKPAKSATSAEYLALRAKTPDTADAHWKLGLWCEKNGLKAEALIEFEAVTHFDPRRDAAWKKRGFVKHQGRWLTIARIAVEKAEADAQRKADAKWGPLLQKWRSPLSQKTKRAEAERALADVKDPRATPSIWKVFAMGSPAEQEVAIDMLGRIDGERSSRALAGLAIFGKTELVRRAAVETLIRRKYDDVFMIWIGLLEPPFKYEVRQVAGPGMPGVLLVEGQRFNVRRFYAPPSDHQVAGMMMAGQPPSSFELPLQTDSKPSPGDWPPLGSRSVGAYGDTTLWVYDYKWAPPPPPPRTVVTKNYQKYEKLVLQGQIDNEFQLEESAKMAEGAQAQLQHDIDMLESTNAMVRERNARVSEALRRVAGQDLGEDREEWLKWWMKRKGMTYIPPEKRQIQTIEVQVPLPYVPQSGPAVVTDVGSAPKPKYCMLWRHDQGMPPIYDKCFAARTPVLTPEGRRGIETLRPGDRVVTANGPGSSQATARILAVRQSQATCTLRLTINGETIVTTESHPFRASESDGWIRAGDLRPGDTIATSAGVARVDSRAIAEAAFVWNLRIEGGSPCFLVGQVEAIVHDGSPIPENSRGSSQ